MPLFFNSFVLCKLLLLMMVWKAEIHLKIKCHIFQWNLKPVKSTAWFLTLVLTSHWTWIFRCTFGKVKLSHVQNRACVLLWPTNKAATEARSLYWLQSLGPNLQGEFLLLRVQAFTWHRSWCLSSYTVKDMVHPVTKCPSGTDLWLWDSEEKHYQVFWGSDLNPSFSWICPRQEWAQGSSRASSPWELRLCHKEVAAEDQSFSLRHMETMCTYFCFGGCALGSCLALAERAGFLSSHITELAVVPWAWGVVAPPSSPCSLLSSLWSLFSLEPASLWVSNNWQPRVAVPSSVGLWTRFAICSGFSYSSFPCFPKGSHKRGQILLFGLAFICVPARQAEKMSPDAWEDKLFQDERALLLVLLTFQGPKLESPEICNHSQDNCLVPQSLCQETSSRKGRIC